MSCKYCKWQIGMSLAHTELRVKFQLHRILWLYRRVMYNVSITLPFSKWQKKHKSTIWLLLPVCVTSPDRQNAFTVVFICSSFMYLFIYYWGFFTSTRAGQQILIHLYLCIDLICICITSKFDFTFTLNMPN